jgi:hypothetical protein
VARMVSLLCCLVMAMLLPAAGWSQEVLLDTFEDDVVGLAPTTPDVGSYSGGFLGAPTVIDPGDGNQRLRCLDDATDGGCRISYQPTGSLDRALTEYVFRIENGGTASGGPNDFDQQLILSPPGTNISIEWSAFARQLGVRVFAGGGETFAFVSGFQWAFDTDYVVEIETHADTDQYVLFIDGQEEATGDFRGVDLEKADRMSIRSGFSTLGAFQIDDVRITPLPEVGGVAAAATALAMIGLINFRRERSRDVVAS